MVGGICLFRFWLSVPSLLGYDWTTAMKPYTRFLFRRARRVMLNALFIWGLSSLIAYGFGAMAGIDDRKNAAAASEAKMAQRIANKWPALLSQAEYMTGMPATQTERK